MEITVIDAREIPGPLWTVGKFAGPMSKFTNPGAVSMHDVSSMVHAVITRLGSAKLSRINIIDHGNEQRSRSATTWSRPRISANMLVNSVSFTGVSPRRASCT